MLLLLLLLWLLRTLFLPSELLKPLLLSRLKVLLPCIVFSPSCIARPQVAASLRRQLLPLRLFSALDTLPCLSLATSRCDLLL